MILEKAQSPEMVSPEVRVALTSRELEVASLLGSGLRRAVVGQRLGIAIETVHTHSKSIFRKLGIDNRMGLALRGYVVQELKGN
jgi:DNA-binding NarL/FixJ family response regulator